MKSTGTVVSEFAFVFKLLPLLQEVETIDRLYRFLLSVVTSGPSVGYSRAMLFVLDGHDSVLRGRYGAERSLVETDGAGENTGFNEMARNVFKNFEHIEANNLTVKARSYSVPLSWHRSALVKAARTTYPVLAESKLSEFATDTFFDYFGATNYIAIPLEYDQKVMAVLAVDRSVEKKRGSVDEISVLYSLVQQTAAAAQRLLESSNNKRKARILSKLHQSVNQTSEGSEFGESLKAALAMVCRAVGGHVCFLKDHAAQKTYRVESSLYFNYGTAEDEDEVTRGFEEILELSGGTHESVSGDGSHPHLKDIASNRIAFFFACPLSIGGDVLGAMAVYVNKDESTAKLDSFSTEDKGFLELCARIIASGIEHVQKHGRIQRAEEFIEEMGSSLIRERERSRIGERSVEYQKKIREDLKHMHEIMTTGSSATSRLLEVSEMIDGMRKYSNGYRKDVLTDRTNYVMTNLFKLTKKAVNTWRPAAEKKGIEVTVRIPERGPSLLVDRDNVCVALDKILGTTSSFLKKGDRMLVECSISDNRALVCVADNGHGLPGDAISRLFMPFAEAGSRNTEKRALSLAGDILQRHSAEIAVKSSASWKTILVLSFPKAASRDRRKTKPDRRRRRERRVPSRTR